MKLRTLIVTVVALAALSLVAFILRRPAPPAAGDPRLNQPLVASAAVEQATTLRLSEGGREVTLTRQPDGTWRVPSYHDMPADFQKLSTFISSLTEAKLQRLVTTNPDRIARLDFKDTKIELLDTTGKVLFSVTLGKHPEAGGGRFVRFGTEDKAWLANLSAWLDTEPKNWAHAELLNVKSDDLAKIEIPFEEDGAVTVTRASKDEPWTADRTPEGQRLKADRISSLIGSLGNIRFSESTEQSDPNAIAAKANLRPFKLTTFGGTAYTVALGRKPEEKKLKSPMADTTSGPASLGSVTELSAGKAAPGKEGDANPLAPEFETVPAGPVYAFVTSSEPSAPVNALMEKRAFQISEYVFTGLPQKADELFESTSAPEAAPAHDEHDHGPGATPFGGGPGER